MIERFCCVLGLAFFLSPTLEARAEEIILTELKAGKIAEACDQLPRWNKATIGGRLVELPGLTKRRAAERALCLTPDA